MLFRSLLCPSLVGHQSFAEELTVPIGVRFSEFGIRNSPGTLGYNDWAGFVGSVCSLVSPAAATGMCACNRDMTLNELCAIFGQRCGRWLRGIELISVDGDCLSRRAYRRG